MNAESVVLIPHCAECDARWLPTDDELARIPRWDDLDEPPEVVFYCPECAGREFGQD